MTRKEPRPSHPECRRIDFTIASGSIAEADARALVIGTFSDVAPSGAARAIDAQLEGAIHEIWRRRMFASRAGEVFVLPSGRHRLRADLVVLAGLGPFDRFDDEAQQRIAENVIRVLLASGIDELATVIWGGGSGRTIGHGLRNLLLGFTRGLRDADAARRFRRIIFCEMDAKRCRQIRSELTRLIATPAFAEIEATLEETRLPESPAMAPEARGATDTRGPDPVYLLVSAEEAATKTVRVHSALLTAGGKATVVSGVREVRRTDWDVLLARVGAEDLGESKLESFGNEMTRVLLADAVRELLATITEQHLVVVHDTRGSQVPWEALRLRTNGRGRVPALCGGLTRRYQAENLSVAKWLEQRRMGDVLDLLLIVNPTQDLPGAEAEGERIERLFGAGGRVRIEKLRGGQATRSEVLSRLRSGEFDVVHYAGHAFFDKSNPGSSGILCARREVLSGADLADLATLPALVFFNACESGRVRGGRAAGRAKGGADLRQRLRESAGVAEAFMRGGLANYLGTYWPVGDDAALAFAETFYTRLLQGRTLGEAVLEGRRAVQAQGSVDWADYLHYGSQEFVVKVG